MPEPSELNAPTLWIEQGDIRQGPVARVAVIAPITKQYTYAIPEKLLPDVQPGKRLLVPFGRAGTPKPAFCLATDRAPWTSTLKPVIEVIDDRSLFDAHLLELGAWIAQYYCCPLGRTLEAMAPEASRKQSGFKTIRSVKPSAKLIAASTEDVNQLRSAKRRAVLAFVSSRHAGIDVDELLEHTNASKAIVNALVKDGWLILETRREPAPAPDFDRPADEPAFDLNDAQQQAVDRIIGLTNDQAFRAVLLFGVSGSGKTEVYIHTIRSVLARGKQAILLVPEIALTTQLMQRLAARFTDVAVIHSGLTGVQRSLTWSAIGRGEKRVIIGTRSAVFAPCPDLGLIVVDEEQESSYKNLQSPRFNTRDVAVKRAQLLSIPVVLGSATPSLETWQNCERFSHFQRIDLPNRVAGLPMPEVEFVDLREDQGDRTGVHLLSQTMERGLTDALSARRQAVLLLNRRGYANFLVCQRCKNPIVCPNCQTNMVFHQTTGKAQCHYCQRRIHVPAQCPDGSCQGKLTQWGMGTQRVEEEVRAKFPQARVARADSDTMLKSADYESVVRQLEQSEIDVLVGTQMIAKGLDFPHVAFVGVVNADTTMAIPDFRAAERTFQLITQVAGRAGRAEAGGRVVVQTLSGLLPSIRFAAKHDYQGFAAHELAHRHRANWPPYARLARVLVTHREDSKARDQARALVSGIREFLQTNGVAADVLGPQSAPLARIRNQYRYDFLLRTGSASELLDLLTRLGANKILTSTTRHAMIDVDPVSLA